MQFDSRFWQRAFLAFTVGLILSFGARLSATQAGYAATTASVFGR